jgi:hypothetical protein
MTTSPDPFRRAALELAPAAALVANYCDHAEHVEEVDAAWIAEASDTLRKVALSLSAELGVSLIDAYTARLQAIEARNVLSFDGSPDGSVAALQAKSWRDLQIVQAAHDRYYHPDVLGLAKSDQLRHYAFHLAKLVAAFAASDDIEELRDRRLPDALLFSIKLKTVIGQRLAEEPLPR